ncbi:hypothetical protein [cf. Phormidesmis sp. LEGE 11477]|uniref:hypothetical protein n=1 Tax=cf. Phormidesmis sp. LEGE 11477 TaxID=1828680 RepID=UPI001882FD7E|nr:hypothetical protein [cf. Phormidesmis sp. LEGE 11477]MBE9062880.1 hypothetical protein [cf. Phormidesmis sp. LEGE 11477]
MNTLAVKQASRTALAFYEAEPKIQQYIQEQAAKGDLPGEYTPTVVEVKFEGLTYLRYEAGEITASRECSKGYVPPFWEICFDEDELALFVLNPGEILLDRTAQIAEMDEILKNCELRSFAEDLRNRVQDS